MLCNNILAPRQNCSILQTFSYVFSGRTFLYFNSNSMKLVPKVRFRLHDSTTLVMNWHWIAHAITKNNADFMSINITRHVNRFTRHEDGAPWTQASHQPSEWCFRFAHMCRCVFTNRHKAVLFAWLNSMVPLEEPQNHCHRHRRWL